ncbi:MAG: helix-turn-helix transcriptional regulator [Sinobacteraceae bacterium]|nr:helix-turn-helix transcriptional regulator [Nevskiaceae bacterium]
MTPTRIVSTLQRLGLTQQQIADEIGVDSRTVWMVIHGRGSSRRVAEHISSLLGIPVGTLWPGRYERPRRKAA